MTPAQAAQLLAIAATFDRRTVGEIEANAWAKALDGLDPGDCAAAIQAHYSRSTDWLMPAHVRTEVRRIRADRHSRAGNAEPDYDPDDVTGGLEAIRRARRAVGDGARTLPPARPVAALAAATLAGMDARMTRPSPGYLAAKRQLAASLAGKDRDSGAAS